MAGVALPRAAILRSPIQQSQLRWHLSSSGRPRGLAAAGEPLKDGLSELCWRTGCVFALGGTVISHLRRRRLLRVLPRAARRYASSSSLRLTATRGCNGGDDVAADVSEAALSAGIVPKVLFVLGGPGAGKGTQCDKIVTKFPQWAHVSAGDCLRAERNDPSSRDGELINATIKEGKIVPCAITVRLLQKAMDSKMAEEGKTHFLIDGFPRDLENAQGWEEVMGADASVCGVLFYEVAEEELQRRLLSRGETSGRIDDNMESIRKRFATHRDATMPIVESFRARGMLFTIDASPSVDEVWAATEAVVEKVMAAS